MPSYNKVFLTMVLLSKAFALPTPQLAGEGALADALFTDTDNGVGYGIENAEDNLATTISSLKVPARRQLAGEGALADALFTDTDNGVGYGIENAEDNLAATVASVKGGAPARRQADKIAKGAQAVAEAAGIGASTTSLTTALENIDGDATSGASDLGQVVGTAEESTLEDTGSAVPKARRQMDKISNGLQAVSEAAGTGASTSALTDALDTIDGDATSGAATLGQNIGSTEESTLEGIGSAVPKRL